MRFSEAPYPTLLISLGTTQAIVPEAFFLPGVTFSAVHVLTSANVSVDLVREFFATHAPEVLLSITRVADFTDLKSENDHFRFEEVLYRWILSCEPIPSRRHVCLTGGFKLMSAAVWKAASILGASQVFHVLADSFASNPAVNPRQPSTIGEILAARDAGHLHFIRLGPESGWPQLAQATAADYPLLEVACDADSTRFVHVSDSRFRIRVSEIVERSHRIAGAWSRLPDLPFIELATWSAQDLAWLAEPLQPTDADWVRSLPKIELHCHLGGFATHGPDLAHVRGGSDPAPDLPPLVDLPFPADWPRPTTPCGLDPYLKLGDNNGSKLLGNAQCLRRQCELLYQRLTEDRVCYAEIRCSPNNYADPAHGRSAFDVLQAIRTTFQNCMDQARAKADSSACHVNLVVIATRKNSGDRSDISRHLALAITAADQWRDPEGCRVVGVDLAGFESRETRAALFQTDFEAIHRVGLAVTVHAGENDDAEGIWQAVFKLDARRLGHALHLADAPDLLRAVTDRGIGVEMCPYANVQIKGFAPIHGSVRYPLRRYLEAAVRVTVNTDNLGISAATLSDNLLLLAELCPGITRREILQLQRNALDAAFVSPETRARLVMRFSHQLPLP